MTRPFPRCWPAFLLPLLLLSGCRTSSQPPPPPSAPVSNFDAAHAFTMLRAQCDFGPRPPRTVAHDQCRAYILQQMTPYVDKIATQNFSFTDQARQVTLPLTNIVGVINPGAAKKVMLFTHWDTRPTADQDLDAANRVKPIPGADDGASGTAVLLELARVFHAHKPTVGVILLFVDGEDWGPKDDKMYLGARYFAQRPGLYKPDYAILLDMIGQKDLKIYREANSQTLHPELNDKVWNAAAAIGDSAAFPGQFTLSDGVTFPYKYTVQDDHVPFNAAGIPAIDLIDFDYGFWHTLQDTPDKCDPQSLKIVGDVMAKVIYDEK